MRRTTVTSSKLLFSPLVKLPDLSATWKVGMKLEAVDKHNAGMVCVATVSNVLDGRVLVHFDGWEIDYDYWVVPGKEPRRARRAPITFHCIERWTSN